MKNKYLTTFDHYITIHKTVHNSTMKLRHDIMYRHDHDTKWNHSWGLAAPRRGPTPLLPNGYSQELRQLGERCWGAVDTACMVKYGQIGG